MRNWKGVAISATCLLAVACGGNEGETARADLESETIGGEGVASSEMAGDDRLAEYEEYEGYSVEPVLPESEMGTGIAPEPGGMAEAETDVAPGIEGDEPDMTGSGIGSAEPMEDEGFAQAQPEPGIAEPAAVPAQGEVCPADIEGLNVRVSTIPRGGALVFTVAREQVEELRDRLDRFALLHGQQHEGATAEPMDAPGEGMGTMGAEGGEMEGHAMEGGEQSQFADAQALIHQATEVRVVDIPRGARLEVRFENDERVSDLRAELREDATMLRDGRCPLALQLERT